MKGKGLSDKIYLERGAGNGEADTESEADTDTGFQKWFNKLTPENIEEYAVPLEDSRQVLKPGTQGFSFL